MKAAIGFAAIALIAVPTVAQVETPTYSYTPLDSASLSRYCLGTATRTGDHRPARAFCQGFVLGAIEALAPSGVGRPGVLYCPQANQISIIARIGYYAEKRVFPPKMNAVRYVERIARELCDEAASQ